MYDKRQRKIRWVLVAQSSHFGLLLMTIPGYNSGSLGRKTGWLL